MRRVIPNHSLLGSSFQRSLSLSLSIWLGVFHALPALAGDDRYAYNSNTYQDFSNRYQPNRTYSNNSPLDRQIRIQNAALSFRYQPAVYSPKVQTKLDLPVVNTNISTFKFEPTTVNKAQQLPQAVKIAPRPADIGNTQKRTFLGTVTSIAKAIGRTFALPFQKLGQAIANLVQRAFRSDRTPTFTESQKSTLGAYQNLQLTPDGSLKVTNGQTVALGHVWEQGSTFKLSGDKLELVQGTTMEKNFGGLERKDGALVPVIMTGVGGNVEPAGIDFSRLNPKTEFNLTQSLRIEGIGEVQPGASMTFEGFKPQRNNAVGPTALLSFTNAKLANPAKIFESLGQSKEPFTLAQAEMVLKGKIYQINSVYMTRGEERYFSTPEGNLLSVNQLEQKQTNIQATNSKLTQESKKLTDDATSAVLHSSVLLDNLRKQTATPATKDFEIKAPVKEQSEAVKSLAAEAGRLDQKMREGDYGEVAGSVAKVESAQKAVSETIASQRIQVETFQDYKRGLRGLGEVSSRLASQADPRSISEPSSFEDRVAASGYFQEEKNAVRIHSTDALMAVGRMADQGILTPAEALLKSGEIISIRDRLLAAKPDVVGNATVKAADAMTAEYESISRDFDEAIFNHLYALADSHPKIAGAIGYTGLAVGGGAAIVGLAYGAATNPATTVVIVGSGVISQKTFEAMGLTRQAAAFYTAIVTAPMAVIAGQSKALQRADNQVVGFFQNPWAALRLWINDEAKALGSLLTDESGAVSIGSKISRNSVPVNTKTFQPITTPYGDAIQSTTPEALAARTAVRKGQTLYKIGRIGKGETADAQFWSLENPLAPGYEARYGMPPGNLKTRSVTFVEIGELKPGASFITRPAPPVGTNPGGGIEVVVAPGDVNLRSFSAGRRKP